MSPWAAVPRGAPHPHRLSGDRLERPPVVGAAGGQRGSGGSRLERLDQTGQAFFQITSRERLTTREGGGVGQRRRDLGRDHDRQADACVPQLPERRVESVAPNPSWPRPTKSTALAPILRARAIASTSALEVEGAR